jgi:hypothetical protein
VLAGEVFENRAKLVNSLVRTLRGCIADADEERIQRAVRAVERQQRGAAK